VAVLAGVGTAVDATWTGAADAGRTLPASLAGLRWRIEAGDAAGAARPAEGSFGTTPPPAVVTPALRLEGVRADPAVLTPNGDGLGEGGRLAWRQSAAGHVRIAVLDARGAEVAVPLDLPDVRAGAQSAPWDGRGPGGAPLPSGLYRYQIRIQPSTPFALPVTSTTPVTLRRGAGPLSVPPVVTPNGDRRRDVAVIRFERSNPGRSGSSSGGAAGSSARWPTSRAGRVRGSSRSTLRASRTAPTSSSSSPRAPGARCCNAPRC
jgi:hypothetical protein